MNSNIKNMMNQYQNSKIKEQTKVREILQETALLGLKRQGFFEIAAFYGGTALRILYGLDRFSEDLDFTLLRPDQNFNFMPYLQGMQRELASFGFEMEVEQKIKNIETSVISAFMKINTIKLYLSIGDEKKSKLINHNEKIQIKLEIDIDPPTLFRVENRIVLNPMSFYVTTLSSSDLFAGKMHAVLYRSWKGRIKGRDWFDLIWFIQNKVPLSLHCLEEIMRQAKNIETNEILNRAMVIELLQAKIQKVDWENAKADVRVFIADPERLEIWSARFFLDLVEHLLVE